ncbi:MAG: alpha/beta hydrolase [Actinomycetota bacterium]|nr:alpha/beta hydrolase [Acidimicrobiales bacterium]MEE2807400.1 alpha/beta hydrolase [Actinomycetota bacterium]
MNGADYDNENATEESAMITPTSQELYQMCANDPEFQMAARYWTGGVRFEMGPNLTGVTIEGGAVQAVIPEQGPGVVVIAGPEQVWEQVQSVPPPRFLNDISIATGRGGLSWNGDRLTWWQYLPAIQRITELFRSSKNRGNEKVEEGRGAGSFDAPTGRYARVNLQGFEHRIYFEEAGQGIPLLLQHTAGSHGVQWRHLFENSTITDHFRLIAYDLPFHGKSIPPVNRRWWAEEYRLEGEFLRSIPLVLTEMLELHQPVFMGCSIGGLLALDLAHKHPDIFRAVISLEGALHIGGKIDELEGFWHPQVSNETKARMMEGLTAPTSPEPYRKETTQSYAAGWPPAFLGDLWYYISEYDLREVASTIDTSSVGVHIFSGEYDYSGTVEKGREAHEAIKGSTFCEMKGIGHFPMSENPNAFIQHLLPVLETIKAMSL